MKTAVTYVMSGQAHVPYLVTSLLSLRRHYDGPVVVHAWPESFDLVRTVCNDPRIDAECVGRVPPYRGKNCQFLDKIRVAQMMTDYDAVMYIDADTLIEADPRLLLSLFDKCLAYEFIATQFNDWSSNVGQPLNRVRNLIGREVDQEAVNVAMTQCFPSPNGGVFAARPDSAILALWEQWTSAVLDIFIADETVLHAIVAKYYGAPSMRLCVASGGHWNCSPKYQPHSLQDDQVCLWHFHGDSNCRPEKCLRGTELWLPVFEEALRQDIGNISRWWRTCGNKHLNNFMESFV